MDLRKARISFFSSDLSSDTDTLVYTSTAGAVVLGGTELAPDHLKKDVKFYPPDDKVFTTTDITGLRVWDSERLAVLYQYKPNQLSRHAYSSDCILSAFDDYNIKFYDLRCRYVLKSFPKGRVQDLAWIGSRLYVYDGDTVAGYDYRSLSGELVLGDIAGFAVSGSSCFMLRREGGDSFLLSLGAADKGGHEVVRKKTRYERILGIKSCDSIACVEGGRVKIEERDRIWGLAVPEKLRSLEAVYFKPGGGYLFMNDDLYEFCSGAAGAL